MTEDLECDGELVRQQDPDRIHVAVARAVLLAHGAEPGHAPEFAALCDVTQHLDARVVAPLVHHEDALARRFRDVLAVGERRGERLLAEHRNTERQQLCDGRGVGDRERRDDRPVDPRQLGDRSDDRVRAACARALPALLGAGDHGHDGAEGFEVAQDMATPVAASDQGDRRRGLTVH